MGWEEITIRDKKKAGKVCGKKEETKKSEMDFEVTSMKRREEIPICISVSGWEKRLQ